LNNICNDLIDYFDPESFIEGEVYSPYLAAITGEIGSGKTLFGRCIFENLRKRKEFMRDCGSEQKPILCSSLTSESQMRFLGIWRPIIQMMLVCHCSKNSLDIHKTLRKMLKNASDENHDIILHLFNMADLKTSGPLKLPLIKDPI
jgi:ABC-type glutathione transport system ATPase component